MSEGAQSTSAGRSGMKMALEGRLELVGKWFHWHLSQCLLGLVGFLGCLRADCSGNMLGWIDWWDVGRGETESGVGAQGRMFVSGSSGFAGGSTM